MRSLVETVAVRAGPRRCEAAEQVEIRVKYEGYIARQQDEIERQQRNEKHLLPATLVIVR